MRTLEEIDMGEIRYIYNPCRICGNNEFELKYTQGDTTLADGTPCIVCPNCGRYGSAAKWNLVN